MKLPGIVLAFLAVGQSAGAAGLNFDFSESYQGLSMSGELVGINVDANGNGSNVDPTLNHAHPLIGCFGLMIDVSNVWR